MMQHQYTQHCDMFRKPSDLNIIMPYTMEHWQATTYPTDVLDYPYNLPVI